MIDVLTANPGPVTRQTPEEKAFNDLQQALFKADPVMITIYRELYNQDPITWEMLGGPELTPERKAELQAQEQAEQAVLAQKAQEFYADPSLFDPFLERQEVLAFVTVFSRPLSWIRMYYRGKYPPRPTKEEFLAMAPDLQELLKKKAFEMAQQYLWEFQFDNPDLAYFLQYLTAEQIRTIHIEAIKRWLDGPNGSTLNKNVAGLLSLLPQAEQSPYLQKWVHNYASTHIGGSEISLPQINIILRFIGQPAIIVSESGMYALEDNARNLVGVVYGSIHGEPLANYLASDWNLMIRDVLKQLGLSDYSPKHEMLGMRVPLSDIIGEINSSGRGGLETANYRYWTENTGIEELGLYYDENRSNPEYNKNSRFYGQLAVVVIIIIVIIVVIFTYGVGSALLGGLLGSSGGYLAGAGATYLADEAKSAVTAELVKLGIPTLNIPAITAVNFVAPKVNTTTPAPVVPTPAKPAPVVPSITPKPGVTNPLDALTAGFDLSSFKTLAPAIATLVVFGFIFSNVGVGSLIKVGK